MSKCITKIRVGDDRQLCIHAEKNGGPLCGGGRDGRKNAAWQHVAEFERPNCVRCLKILVNAARKGGFI